MNNIAGNKIVPHKKQNKDNNNGQLCKEEIDELREAFKVFEEEPGKANPENIIKMFKDMGYESENKHLVKMFENLTEVADEKGFINYQQFLDACNRFLGINTPDDYLENVFNMFIESPENVNIF